MGGAVVPFDVCEEPFQLVCSSDAVSVTVMLRDLRPFTGVSGVGAEGTAGPRVILKFVSVDAEGILAYSDFVADATALSFFLGAPGSYLQVWSLVLVKSSNNLVSFCLAHDIDVSLIGRGVICPVVETLDAPYSVEGYFTQSGVWEIIYFIDLVLSSRPFFFIWPTLKKQQFLRVESTLKLRVDSTLKNGNFDEFTSASFSEKGL